VEPKAVRYRTERGVAWLTLHRPHRRNAWTGRMHAEYRHFLAEAEADPSVRVVVLTGAGRDFCVGADAQALEGHVEKGGYDPGTPEDLARPGVGAQPELDADFAFQLGIGKPLVAAIHGAAAGVGLVAACYCDLRFAAAGARLTTAHGRLGLPAEYGLSWLLPRMIGLTHACDLLLSSRVFLAEEALALGLLNGVHPAGELLPRVGELAERLAREVSPASLRATKQQIVADLHRDVASAVRDADVRMRDMMRGPDFREGVAALSERRTPRFADPRPPADAASDVETHEGGARDPEA